MIPRVRPAPPAITVRAIRAIPMITIRIDITRVEERWNWRGPGIYYKLKPAEAR